MADNPTIDNGTGTDYTVATDDDGSAQHQYVKVEFGADNTQTKVTSSVGLPVAGTGTAGSAATGVVTIQGIASGTVVPVSISADVPGTGATNSGKAVDSAAGATDTGTAALVVRDDALATLTPADGDYTHLRVTSTGALWVQNTGAYVDDADFTDSSSVGIGIMGVAEGTPSTVTDGDMGMLAIDPTTRALKTSIVSGTATITGTVDATILPGTTGGLSTMAATSQDSGTALTNSAQAIKAAAGHLYGWYIYNPNDEVCYVNFYNTAFGSVTVGTTVPLFHLAIPPAQGANLLGPVGVAFSTAMSWSATKTAGSATAPDTALEAVCFYK